MLKIKTKREQKLSYFEQKMAKHNCTWLLLNDTRPNDDNKAVDSLCHDGLIYSCFHDDYIVNIKAFSEFCYYDLKFTD